MKLLATILGLVVGAIALSLANTGLHKIFLPNLFKTGLYVLVYLLFVPQGAWLGAFTGFGIAAGRRDPHRNSGIALVAGGVMFLIASVWDLIGDLRSDPSQIHETVANFFIFFGVALAWALGLIIWGTRVVKASKPVG